MKFSESTQSFYPDDIDYPNLPADATTIADGDYPALFEAVNGGRHVYFYRKKPVCSDVRPDNYHQWDISAKVWAVTPEAEQQKKDDDIAAAQQKQQSLIDEALQSISIVQLKLQAKRTLTETEQARLNSILDYIDALSAIDTSSAPDIAWPVQPA